MDVDRLAEEYGIDLGAGHKERGWLALAGLDQSSLERLAKLARLDVAQLAALQHQSHQYPIAHRLRFCFECLYLNPYDVSAPFWQRGWFNADDSLCPIHRTRFQTIARSVLSTNGNFRKLLQFISRREQRRLWQEKFFGH